VVLRSSEPSKVTDEGVRELKITDVYNLRSRQAKEWEGDLRPSTQTGTVDFVRDQIPGVDTCW
jgi:hypothetical protein